MDPTAAPTKTSSTSSTSTKSTTSSKSIVTEYVTTVTLSSTTTWSVADTTYIAQIVSETIEAYPPEDSSKSSLSLNWGPLIPPSGTDAHTHGSTTIVYEPVTQSQTSGTSGLTSPTSPTSGSNDESSSPSSSPSSSSNGGLNTGAKAGIAIGAIIGAILLAAVAYMLGRRRNKKEIARAVAAEHENLARSHPQSPGHELAARGYYGGQDFKKDGQQEHTTPVYELNAATHAELPVWVDRPELKGSAVEPNQEERRPDSDTKNPSTWTTP